MMKVTNHVGQKWFFSRYRNSSKFSKTNFFIFFMTGGHIYVVISAQITRTVITKHRLFFRQPQTFPQQDSFGSGWPPWLSAGSIEIESCPPVPDVAYSGFSSGCLSGDFGGLVSKIWLLFSLSWVVHSPGCCWSREAMQSYFFIWNKIGLAEKTRIRALI